MVPDEMSWAAGARNVIRIEIPNELEP